MVPYKILHNPKMCPEWRLSYEKVAQVCGIVNLPHHEVFGGIPTSDLVFWGISWKVNTEKKKY